MTAMPCRSGVASVDRTRRTSYGTLAGVTGLKIGYARVPTVGQDLTAQRDGLAALGVDAERVYVDHA